MALRITPARILRALPYFSLLCVLVGVAWLLTLPRDDNARHTYISENALLPGQVHTYFSGSEQDVFRAYRWEVRNAASIIAGSSLVGINGSSSSTADLISSARARRVDAVADIFKGLGLKVGRQKYKYNLPGGPCEGENVYAVFHAPRGDATESVVLVAPWRNMDGIVNEGGVALVLTLARYFSRWSLWSKDIIFLIASDARTGPQAWVDAYHDTHTRSNAHEISSLPLVAGAIQGVVVLDYPVVNRFDSIHIVYDGVNGQLPNLDLINTAVQIASGQMGIRTTLQDMWTNRVGSHEGHAPQSEESYRFRLRTMLRGMVNQALGHVTGAHSAFIPYHIDAITLQVQGEGWHDEVQLGRTVESIFRSLNNLLEHFHQSFFFYLLLSPRRFVSIGTYLPSAMLVAASFTIMAIGCWRKSADMVDDLATELEGSNVKKDKTDPKRVEKEGISALVSSPPDQPPDELPFKERALKHRNLVFPLAFNIAIHFCGFAPLYVFNTVAPAHLSIAFRLFTLVSSVLPIIIAAILPRIFTPAALPLQLYLIRTFSLLFVGLCLSSLATLNFSLALLTGLFASPLIFASPLPQRKFLAVFALVAMNLVFSPSAMLYGVSRYMAAYLTGIGGVAEILKEGQVGWGVWGMWMSQGVVWGVWWPAWIAGCVQWSLSFFVSPDERWRR